MKNPNSQKIRTALESLNGNPDGGTIEIQHASIRDDSVCVNLAPGGRGPWLVSGPGSATWVSDIDGVMAVLAKMPLSESTEPCYCYPTVIGCVHCERAARYVQIEVYTLANELGEAGYASAIDGVEGAHLENECSTPEPVDQHDIVHHYSCDVSMYSGDPEGFDWEDRTPNPDGPPCDFDCGEDPESEIQDVLQWFIISTWLANRLREIGEPVLDYMGLELWGRTCCGQGIALDGTFQRVSRRLGV